MQQQKQQAAVQHASIDMASAAASKGGHGQDQAPVVSHQASGGHVSCARRCLLSHQVPVPPSTPVSPGVWSKAGLACRGAALRHQRTAHGTGTATSPRPNVHFHAPLGAAKRLAAAVAGRKGAPRGGAAMRFTAASLPPTPCAAPPLTVFPRPHVRDMCVTPPTPPSLLRRALPAHGHGPRWRTRPPAVGRARRRGRDAAVLEDLCDLPDAAQRRGQARGAAGDPHGLGRGAPQRQVERGRAGAGGRRGEGRDGGEGGAQPMQQVSAAAAVIARV